MFIVDTSRICFSDCTGPRYNEPQMTAQERDCFNKCVFKTMGVHTLVEEPMDKVTKRFEHLM